jgi:hypothetical protein
MHVGLGEIFTQGKRDSWTLKKKSQPWSFYCNGIALYLHRFWFPTRAFRILELKGNPVQYRSCPRNCKFEFRCTAVKQLLQIPAIGSSELRRPAKVKRARRPASIFDSELSEEKQVEAYRGCISFGVKLFFISIFSSQAGFD